MGRKPFKKSRKTRIYFTEEEIEDMKNPYWINGKLIYALNEEIAKEIYNRNFSKLEV